MTNHARLRVEGWRIGTAEDFLDDHSEVEVIASRFHGGLAALHAVAVWFNLRKKNYIDASIHAAFVLYDLGSAVKHHKQAGEKQ